MGKIVSDAALIVCAAGKTFARRAKAFPRRFNRSRSGKNVCAARKSFPTPLQT